MTSWRLQMNPRNAKLFTKLQYVLVGILATKQKIFTFVIGYEDLALHRVATVSGDSGLVAGTVALGLASGDLGVAFGIAALVPREGLVQFPQLEALARPESVFVVVRQLGTLERIFT